MTQTRSAKKINDLLDKERIGIIESLGRSAYDLLTPAEAAQELGVSVKLIPDLIRHGWLEKVPGKDIGRGHQYYRWRVLFTKQFRQTKPRKKNVHTEASSVPT